MKRPSDHQRALAELAAGKDASLATLVGIAGLNPATDLVGADFRGVDFAGDDLEGYNLSRADLRGADLRRAKHVDGAMFADVITDERTQWPNPSLYPGKVISDAPYGLDMILIPSGRYMRGTTTAELRREKVPKVLHGQERPRKEVTIRQPFLLGRTPVTVGQFARFVEDSGHKVAPGVYTYIAGKSWERTEAHDWRNPGFPQTDDHPVTCVGPEDADEFARWLSHRTGKEYRLPSEAEWEYACRAGTTTARFWGDDRPSARLYANVADLSLARELKREPKPDEFFQHDDGYAFTSPVGAFGANPWGLHDMLGNVWEWVADDWFDSHEGADCTDAKRTTTGSGRLRVLRGGSWYDDPWSVRSASRDGYVGRYTYSGFRLARTL